MIRGLASSERLVLFLALIISYKRNMFYEEIYSMEVEMQVKWLN
jgi:hypothetical protein